MGELLQISGESNHVTVSDDGELLENEHCTKDTLTSAAVGSPVYDCITMSRNDMEAPNVILRYSFSPDCTSFDKLVRVLPGASVGSDGNDITPHICKITAVKQTPAAAKTPNVSQCPSEEDFDEEGPCDYDGKCEFGEESCC